MSHSTVEQKLGLLFDLVDSIDGFAGGIKPQGAIELIRTIFERSQYFYPTYELQNTLEYVFSGTVSMVYRAFWTNADQEQLLQMIKNPNELNELEKPDNSIDVTHLV